MNRIFLRIYASVLISLLLLLVAQVLMVQYVFKPELDAMVESWVRPAATWLRAEAMKAGSNQPIKALLPRDKKSLPLDVVSVPRNTIELTEQQASRLTRGAAVAVGDWTHRIVYIEAAESDKLLRLGPVPVITNPVDWRTALAGFCAFLTIGLGIQLVLKPIKHDLMELSDAAEQFGQGDFGRRAQVRAHGSIRYLAASFNAMAEQTARLIESHKELLRAASHELRTPLARIVMSVDSLEEAEDHQERQDLMGGIYESLDELEGLIEEMLVFTRLQAGSPETDLESFQLAPIFEEALDVCQPHLSHLEIEITLPSDSTMIQGQPRMLRRVLDNLLTNAGRYATNQVRVSCRELDEHIIITVEDDGPGIPPDDRERIFEPFVRLDASRSRHSGGFGLGLSIAQRIAGWHGGSLRADASPLGGAKLYLELPTADDA